MNGTAAPITAIRISIITVFARSSRPWRSMKRARSNSSRQIHEKRGSSSGRIGPSSAPDGRARSTNLLRPYIHNGPSGGPRGLFSHAECDTDLDASGRYETWDVMSQSAEIVMPPGLGKPLVPRDDQLSLALRRPHPLLTPIG